MKIQDQRSGCLDEIQYCGQEVIGRTMVEKRLKVFEDMLTVFITIRRYDRKIVNFKAESKGKK